MSFFGIFGARKGTGFSIPIPQASQEDWEKNEARIFELGFRFQQAPQGSSHAFWPSPTRIYAHEIFYAFAELTLLPTQIFEIRFTTLFPGGSVRTVAGEKLLTLSAASFNDHVQWKSGSLASVWEEHMNRVAEFEKEFRARPVALNLEMYRDFLDLLQTSLSKAVREERLIPETVHDYLLMGYAYLNLGKKKKALEMFRAAAALDPKNGRLAWLAGRMALFAGDLKAAAENFRVSLILRPWDRATYFLSAENWKLLGKKREAFYVLKRAKEFFPADPEIALHLGITAVDVGDLEAARESLEEINNPKGASAELFTALGKLYRKMKDRKKAEEYFRLARVFARQKSDVKLPWEL